MTQKNSLRASFPSSEGSYTGLPGDAHSFNSPDRPFQGFRASPFPSSATDLYLSMDTAGDSLKEVVYGIQFICDDPQSTDLLDVLRKGLETLPPPGKYENSYLDSRVFISGDPSFKPNVKAGEKEVSVFIRPGGSGDAGNYQVSLLTGDKWKHILQLYLDTPPDSNTERYLGLFADGFTEEKISLLIKTGALEDLVFEDAAGFLQFVQLVNISLSPLATLAGLAGAPILSSALIDSLCATFEAVFWKGVDDEVSTQEYIPLDMIAQEVSFLAGLQSQYGWFLSSIPICGFAALFFLGELTGIIDASDAVRLANAMIEFKTSLANSLSSQPNLDKMAAGFLSDLEKNRQELEDLLVGGAVVGGVAFIVGMIFQILFDIVNAFFMIIYYYWQATKYMYGTLWKNVTDPDDPDRVAASPDLISTWFASFDVKEFAEKDLPVIYEKIKTLIQAIVADFIEHATEYGTMTGDFIAGGLSGALGTGLGILFEAYDPKASVLDRIWFVVQQYYYLGAIIGPVLVDIILFFCSGGESGVLTAASKLGKTEELAAALEFVRRGAASIRALTGYKRVTTLLAPLTELTEVITGVFERLWNAIGPAVEQVKAWVRLVYEVLPAEGKIRDVNTLLTAIDRWSESCSSLNAFIGIILLLSGEGSIDKAGNVTVAA